MLAPYTELHCLSNFSFLRGASHPEELVRRALALEYGGLAITDECSFAGSVRAHLALEELRISDEPARSFRLIHGTEIQLAEGEGKQVAPGARLLLLAQTRAGYGNLSQLVSLGRQQAAKGSYRLSRADLEAHAGWLTDVLVLLLPQRHWREPFDAARIGAATQEARWLADLKPAASWIACELTRSADDAHVLASMQAIGDASGLPLVAAGDVQMHLRSRKPLHDVLAAVRLKTPVAQCGRELAPNAERHLRPLYRLARIYPTELLLQTQVIAERCHFSLAELSYEYPHEIVPAGETPRSWLRKATEMEARQRYPGGVPAEVRALIEMELGIIAELNYEPYFLTVYDIVRKARQLGILCQGRGSAANSAVCYCLGITEVKPTQLNALFGRFVSVERREPPDIDVDFEHERREEIMQYIYGKYGRERTALTAALHTYHPRGALRDVGKALGLSLDQVDRLARTTAWWDGRRPDPARFEEAGFDPANPIIVQLADRVQELVGFPRHLSQHSGGFVIARDRLDRLVPIENAAMDKRTVIQWDKDDLDALRLLKVDVLALGMLTCLRRAFDHIRGFGAGPTAMAEVPVECAKVYDMLCRGDSVGVFQVESRAQMNMLPRLAPRKFYDLVIQVAIVRPGPIQGGMVHPYLRRRQKLEAVTYYSDAVKAVLERTEGVPIFQEQVMKLAEVAAGFTPGEADQLRRAMAAWKRKGGLGPFRDRLITGMTLRGYPSEFAEQIYRQIEGFGEYGFPESHAASFALLVYQSAWLKCHQPAAFCAALLDSQPLGFYPPAQLVRDAIDHGVEMRAVDVMASDWDCTLEPSSADPAIPAVRLGLRMVSGLSEATGRRIAATRATAPFTDAQDLAQRAGLDRREINALAAADALASLAGHRRQALWATLGVDGNAPRNAPLAAHHSPEQQIDLLPPTEGQNIVADYHHTSLTLRRHPLALLREGFNARGYLSAADIGSARNKQRVRTAGIVTCRQRPGTASGVIFVTIEDETGTVNVVVWNTTAKKYRPALLRSRLMTVYGHVERVTTGTVPIVHLIAARLEDHSSLLGRLSLPSRDFH